MPICVYQHCSGHLNFSIRVHLKFLDENYDKYSLVESLRDLKTQPRD